MSDEPRVAGTDRTGDAGVGDGDIDAVAAAAGERFESLVEHAIETEMASGRREKTVEKAKRNIFVRVGILLAGSLILIVGLVLLVMPGPGVIVVALGLGLLAMEVPFAARLLDRIQDRIPRDEQGHIPKGAIVMMVAMCTTATGLSVWWAIR